MIPAARFCLAARIAALVFLFSVTCLRAQEQAQKAAFYDVQISKEEIYKYSGLKFTGDYTSWQSPSGVLALGRTDAGVTVVIVLGGGTVTFETPEAVQEKLKSTFNSYPLKTNFTTLYMRLHPKEYDETIGKIQLTKAPDDSAYAKAKELFDTKFLGSFHAGPRAILPPYKTRWMEFDAQEFGQILNEEGYWVKLNRLSPYGKVYPSNFVNPKQR